MAKQATDYDDLAKRTPIDRVATRVLVGNGRPLDPTDIELRQISLESLKGAIQQTELQLRLTRSAGTRANPAYQTALARRAELFEQYNRLRKSLGLAATKLELKVQKRTKGFEGVMLEIVKERLTKAQFADIVAEAERRTGIVKRRLA